MLEISFFGVRGSTPCSCETTMGVGGNTSCVVVEAPGGDPFLLDLGTGLRYAGEAMCAREHVPSRGTALVTHLHWDHIQGLPFFAPLLREGSAFRIVGPPQDGTLREAFEDFVGPPLFPIGLDLLPAELTLEAMERGSFDVDGVTVTVAPVPHVGATNGYRLDHAGGSVAYLPDHQQPADMVPSADVLELCRDVDVLIHDAQYTPDEFVMKATWGHSTPEFALRVATEAGAKRLVLFHHDPVHDDAAVHAMADELRASAPSDGPEIIVAVEGLVLSSGRADSAVGGLVLTSGRAESAVDADADVAVGS